MEVNTKYATFDEILSRVTTRCRGFDKTINEADIIEWCMQVENEIAPNVDNMYIYTCFPLKVHNGKAKVPCNRYRIADVTLTPGGHARGVHFNDIGSHIVFDPRERLKVVFMDYWGTPIDLETGKPMIQRGHELACEWYCMYNLFFGDLGTGKINGIFWNEIKENKVNEILACQSSSVHFKTRTQMNDEMRITFDQLPEPARLWLLREEGFHSFAEEEIKRKHKVEVPVPLQRVPSGLIAYGNIAIADSVHKDGVVNDETWVGLIPAGRVLQYIWVENTTTNAAQLSMGTTSGGNDIFASATINPKVGSVNGATTITVGGGFSLQNATNVFLNHAGAGDTFNSSTLNFIFLFSK